MNQIFYRIYLYSTIIISFVIGIPYLFYFNNDSRWSYDLNAGWAFAGCLFVYTISVLLAKLISKEQILVNKAHKIISLVLVVLLLGFTGFLISNNDFSTVRAILLILSALSFGLCLIVSISFVIKIIQNRKSINIDFGSVIYPIFFVLTSSFTLYSAYQYLLYLNYADEYLHNEDFFLYLCFGISLIYIGILILSLLVSLIILAFKNRKWVVFIGSIFLSLLLFVTLFFVSLNASEKARYKTVYISNREYYEPSDDITVEYAKSYKEDDNNEQDIENSDGYARTVTLPEGVKPRRFGFLSKNKDAEEDSVRLAIENNYTSFSPYRWIMFYFPDKNFDYLEENPRIKTYQNRALKPGEVTAYRIMAYLNNTRNAEILWGLYLQYKDLLYKLIPSQTYYSKEVDLDVKILLQAYDDLSRHEESFSIIYDVMTRDDSKTDEKFAVISDYISKESYELNVELNHGNTSNYILCYSFWARRWHEGNLDVSYTILSDVNEHYKKEKAKK